MSVAIKGSRGFMRGQCVPKKVNWAEIRLWIGLVAMILVYGVREAHKVIPEVRKDLKTSDSILNGGIKFYLCGCTACAKPI